MGVALRTAPVRPVGAGGRVRKRFGGGRGGGGGGEGGGEGGRALMHHFETFPGFEAKKARSAVSPL